MPLLRLVGRSSRSPMRSSPIQQQHTRRARSKPTTTTLDRILKASAMHSTDESVGRKESKAPEMVKLGLTRRRSTASCKRANFEHDTTSEGPRV
jgi:hypothetical protein